MKTMDDSFCFSKRYKYVKHVGTGTYGTVVAALDQSHNKKVAIKKLRQINDIFDAKRVLREIRILKNLLHDNILGVTDILYCPKPK
jgi:serine/threonine protein kinase